MRRLRLVVLRRDERALLERLGELGLVQLTVGPATQAGLGQRDFAAEQARWGDLAGRATKLRSQLLTEAGLEDDGRVSALTASELEGPLRDLELRAAALLQERGRLREQRETLERQSTEAQAYADALEALGDLRAPGLLRFILGTVPDEHLSALTGPDAAFLPLANHHGGRALLAVTCDGHLETTRSQLEAAGFVPATPGLLEGAYQSRGQAKALGARQAEVEAALVSLAGDGAPWLAAVGQRAAHEAALQSARSQLQRSDACILLTGWVPAAATAGLEEQVAALTGRQYCLDLVSAADLPDEEIPVLLTHSRLLRPFAALVQAYGLPRYGEVVPTLWVALSYVVMFGMMFGDVGHGLVLLALGWLLLRRRPKLRDAAVILCWGGLASVLFGAAYGSCFGLEFAHRLALWRDPIEGNPITLMLLAIGLGVVLVSLGLVLNIVNHLRRGQVWHALSDGLGISGLVFYWSALALAVWGDRLAAGGPALRLLTALTGLPLVLWLLREPLHRLRRGSPEHEGFAAVCIGALVETFESVLVFLANTISFVRLAAYAMSHAALLLAIATLAHEIGRVPLVGAALSTLVLLGGNLMVMLLEGIVAGVQALRLEYYEFFSKFFPGNGRPFTPFRLQPCGVPYTTDWDASGQPGKSEEIP
jgi:V/A-type H+-transporting ATPase subunit I